MKNLLITGATGFIGNNLASHLLVNNNYNIFTVSRSTALQNPNSFFIEDISSDTDWTHPLKNIDVVVHCAAASSSNFLSNDLIYQINVSGTINLVQQCIDASVKRFIFISTIKVLGNSTCNKNPFFFDDKHIPVDFYAQSKSNAETLLKNLCDSSGIEFVIIRPPLVYGPGVKGNFASLLALTQKRLFLPFGSTVNKRSMVSVQNLVDLIVKCIDHPNAANQTFLVSDDEDISTSDLLRLLGIAANKPARLVKFPVSLLRFIANFLGKGSAIDRLTGSLQVDITHTKSTLNWSPPLTLKEGLKSCFQSKDD